MAFLQRLSSSHTPGRLLLHSLEDRQELAGDEQQHSARPRAWPLAGRRRAAPARARTATCLASPASSSGSPASSSPAPGSSSGQPHPSTAPSPSGGGGEPGGSGPGTPGSSTGGGQSGPAPSNGTPGGGGSSSGKPGSGGSSALSGLVAALQDAGRLLSDPAFADVPVPTIYLGGLPAPIPAGGCASGFGANPMHACNLHSLPLCCLRRAHAGFTALPASPHPPAPRQAGPPSTRPICCNSCSRGCCPQTACQRATERCGGPPRASQVGGQAAGCLSWGEDGAPWWLVAMYGACRRPCGSFMPVWPPCLPHF